jgi:hypothetical protein
MLPISKKKTWRCPTFNSSGCLHCLVKRGNAFLACWKGICKASMHRILQIDGRGNVRERREMLSQIPNPAQVVKCVRTFVSRVVAGKANDRSIVILDDRMHRYLASNGSEIHNPIYWDYDAPVAISSWRQTASPSPFVRAPSVPNCSARKLHQHSARPFFASRNRGGLCKIIIWRGN